ncbi:hypothetical protein TD95_003425 [Thielaviopsis punctulata]|uniref:Mitochondrial presequence protease n=1 Tax=Thielaviopsis punctulata TaxID=72032 RepID=A0A0F4Z9N1_9PEZI|nr:hypothetical protein TD95_003425 [Thielaviopsis punctulata]
MPSSTAPDVKIPPQWKLVERFDTEFVKSTISLYRSERSGMSVIVNDRVGPKVHGEFVVATEIFDHSGAPHTLEHLIFLGSRSYPYKGLLDSLASRAYSATNAYTAVDRTVYTMETAGWEGFAQILPIYLEHIILPTITDAACTTEVWHINGEANDSGVVYSEMQALEFQSQELIDQAQRRLMYAKNIGYRYETGGMPEELRSLSNERIRQFHRDMYQPRNLCLVICGTVDHNNMLQILDNFEKTIENDIPNLDSPFQRPWVDSVQPELLKETVSTFVEFPDEDESTGELSISWLGPSCNDIPSMVALNVIFSYLCGSSASIMENLLVEKEQLTSSCDMWCEERLQSVIGFRASGVASDKLEETEERILEVLNEVVEKPLDMEYLHSRLRYEKRSLIYSTEEIVDSLAESIVLDFVYGARDGSSLKDLKTLNAHDAILAWSEPEWRAFIKKWLVDNHHVCIKAIPSADMVQKIKSDEIERIAKRKKELGKDELKRLGKVVEDAQAQNNRPIPPEVIAKFPVPGTESIKFIKSDSARLGPARRLGIPDTKAQVALEKLVANPDDPSLPFIQFEQVPSNFVHVYLHFSTDHVPVKLKPLLRLFRENFFNTPIIRDGKKLDFEQVVNELENDTIRYSIKSAQALSDPDSNRMMFAVETDKYATVIRWIKTFMFDSVFDKDRLLAAVSKILADVPEYKRDGYSMTSEVAQAIHLKPESAQNASRVLVQGVFYRRLKKHLQTDPEKVIGWLETVRKAMFKWSATRILVIGDLAKIENPIGAWDDLKNTQLKRQADEELLPIIPPNTMRSDEGMNPGGFGAVIVPMPTLDNSYGYCTTNGFSDLKDARLPATYVAISYLEAVEGPLWNAVRGKGLAYGNGFARDIESGCIKFYVYRSPDVTKALLAARNAIQRIVDGEDLVTSHQMEGAISQLVNQWAGEQSTMTAAALSNFILGVVQNLPGNWNELLMSKVRAVTPEDMRTAMKEVLMPLFEAGRSNIVITCNPNLTDTLKNNLAMAKFETRVQTLDEFENDYGLQALDPDNDQDSEDDDEYDDEEDDSDWTMSGDESD